jgi:hypothetical protein
VFGCVTTGGDEVAVKLTPTPAEARAEAAALASWAGTGVAVPLIAADPEHGALLLRRIRPGTRLAGGGPQAAGAPFCCTATSSARTCCGTARATWPSTRSRASVTRVPTPGSSRPAAGIFPRAAAMATRRPDQAELEATVSSGAFGQLIHR